MTTPLQWTRTLPTVPGWYWVDVSVPGLPRVAIVEVTREDDDDPASDLRVRWTDYYEPVHTLAKHTIAGPIVPPAMPEPEAMTTADKRTEKRAAQPAVPAVDTRPITEGWIDINTMDKSLQPAAIAMQDMAQQSHTATIITMRGSAYLPASVPARDVPAFLQQGGSFWSPEDHVRYVEAVERGEVPGVGVIRVDSKVKP
jgi:hypothetical protein